MDYKKLSVGLAVVVAFLAGCVVHDVVAVAPPARAGTSPQRWEYHCENYDGSDPAALSSMSNKAGSEGWEMAASTMRMMCFKRGM